MFKYARIVLLAGFTVSLLNAQPMQSAYTKDFAKECKHIFSQDDGYISEDICKGYGDIQIKIIHADIRADMALILQGKTYDLNFGRYISPTFSKFGPNLEWRYPKGEPNKPVAMIARYIYQTYIPEKEEYPDLSVLVVTKITNEEICIVGKVPPGANQNKKARAMADKAASMACLKKDRP